MVTAGYPGREPTQGTDMRSSRTPGVSLHRRILLLFLISIALPGLYLSYVGVRSSVQEQELQRGLLIQNVEKALAFEIDRIEARLEESEQQTAGTVFFALDRLSSARSDTADAPPHWVERIFVFDERLNLCNPRPFASEAPAGQEPAIREPLLQRKLQSAELLERRGDVVGAISTYQQLLAGTHSLRGTVTLNTYLARSAIAIGDQLAARRSYDAIIAADSTFRITQPIPYAAFAWLEVIDSHAKDGDGKMAVRRSLQFYRCLLNFYYHLSAEQFEYFSHRVHSSLISLAGRSIGDAETTSMLDSLEERERSLRTMLDRAEAIASWLHSQQRTLPVVPGPKPVSHQRIQMGEQSFPISLTMIEKPTGRHYWVALVIRPEEVRREFILPGLQSSDLASGFDLTLREQSSGSASGTELVRSRMHGMAEVYPSMEIAVFPKQTSTTHIFGVHMSFLSVGLGLLVVGIVLLGILLIYRDIRREAELSRMKSEFISNVSHELKTPISAIRMLADNLRESRVPQETRKQEYYQLIAREGARLSHLIDNILDFSRVEGKRKVFQFEKRDVTTIAVETVRQFTSLMDEHSQDIDFGSDEGLPEIMVDPDAVALALFNLLDNAVKYSEQGSVIGVRVRRHEGDLCIEVADHGVGIPIPDREKIFQKFYRVQRPDGKRVPGSGIGLTLVREVAEAHHGRVEVQSATGVGSTFRILLPIGG
jgi:signal transduction histidine kinase